VVSEASGGPTNLQTVGVAKAAEVLIDLIRQCCKNVDCSPADLQNAVLGIAGAGRASDRNELVDKLFALGNSKKFPLKNITIETDARIALEAAFAGTAGIVVIAGTGSIALYRTEDGQLLRVGGWGKLIGDEGSAYTIGRDALNMIMRHHDGRSEKTLLTVKAMQHFSVSAIEDIIPKLYHEAADIASFAPKVFEAAVERDLIAHSVVLKNATELSELVRTLVMHARPKKKLPVALMGGLLETENIYSKVVKDKILNSLPQIVIQKPKFPTAFGAAIIGLNAFR
jgi:N-acetylglucosamine kinase-like BadF-type ATPase